MYGVFTRKPMKSRMSVVILAVAVTFALAVLPGFPLASDSAVYAQEATNNHPPEFDSNADYTRTVFENTPPGVNIGDPVLATDPDEDTVEYGDTLTYSLQGADASLFSIDSSTGQLTTKAPLDFENPQGGIGNTSNTYEVTVKVEDAEGSATDVTQPVTITVTDVAEPPAAPIAPTVVSGADNSTTSLKVIWHPPENTGNNITRYYVQYKEATELSFTDAGHSSNATTTTISGREPDTSYQVRVRAQIGEDTGEWSLVGTGSTNKENNSPPSFGQNGPVTLNVFENTSAGQDVGAPVTANDDDASALTYRLEGPDAVLFAFVTSSGQIRTKTSLNHENPECGYVSTENPSTCTYRVTVTVNDAAGGSDATAANIMVIDTNEPLLAPSRPTVRATENSSTSLDASWTAPVNMGPPITGYAVRHRIGSEGSFLNDNCGSKVADNCDNLSDIKTTIVALKPGSSHQVQVRATFAGRRMSVWSDLGTGSTNPANREPRFGDRPSSGTGSMRADSYTISRDVDENTRPGQPVGRAVRADDGDGDRRTYKLQGTDASSFDIDEASGQIRTKSPLNHENTDCGYVSTQDPTTCSYMVEVTVSDSLNMDKVEEDTPTPDDNITVTINVRDKDEVPTIPTVTVVTAPIGNTALNVIWDEPDNTGPTPISYDLQYRKGGGAFSNDNCGSQVADNCDLLTSNSVSILGLDADTSYSVQVRARNDEGPSTWSRLITIKTNKGTNAPPTFPDNTPTTFDVVENTASGQIIGIVTADDEDSDTLNYSLEGADATAFNFNTKTGEIRTKSSLDYEDEENRIYSVRVKANDGNDGGSAAHSLTINVTDETEAPASPAAPRVTATKDSGWSLDVTWNEPPQNAGKPSITDYDIRYRKFGETDEAAWQTWPHGEDSATDDNGNTERSAKITRRTPDENAAPLESRTQYEVQVRATNAEGTSGWSTIGRGTTGAGNRRPSFDNTDAVVTLAVDENTRSGQNVGSAVSASDPDGNRLRYTLEGPNKDLFTIVSSSGQIRTRSPLDYESRKSYSVTVKVDDGSGRANSGAAKSVTIEIADEDEIPPAPAAPKVAGIPGSTDSVRVTWSAPAYTGPSITDYEVRYGEAGSGGWNTLVGRSGADRSEIITGLISGTRYEVQVRAKSDEGTGEWSRSGTGSPNADAANRRPSFTGGTRSFNVSENELPNTDIGSLVAATDADGDTLTYSLEGADAASFNILSTGGGAQIQTNAALNHEKKSTYSITVRVTDGRGGTDAVNLTIRVTDVDGEAPDTPFAPTVTAVSSTSLQVSWAVPDNEGPPITDYGYRYRELSASWTEVTNTAITATTVTIEGLEASTPYDVEVRATNAEGTSDWSNPGIGSTNAPGANNLPVFAEGVSATRSVSASAPAGTSIGLPFAATDADQGATLTYSLDGADFNLFRINSSTGQLQTKAGVTLTVGSTYNVTVVARDETDSASISVTITATAAPPNNSPVFSEGVSTTRTVARSAPAGTSIGRPVTATDADQGATLTYSLEGTNAASFSINGSTGQLLTRAGVTLPAGSYPVTVVARDQLGASGRITVTITIVPNVAPVFASTSYCQKRNENVAAGTAVGSPVTATDTDNDTLTYTLGGADAARFAIGSSTGQITVGSGTTLDYETRTSYSVVVTATDPSGERDTINVTINVSDVRQESGRFDTDNDGSISRDEVFGAIQQFLTGQATRDDVLSVILRFISG